MFLAAFTSRSCATPQLEHTHALTPSALSPFGPERMPQSEQVTLENVSLPETQTPASLVALYSILKFFQVDSTGMFRMTSSARYFKKGVGSSRPN
jgi:hypothetical protein